LLLALFFTVRILVSLFSYGALSHAKGCKPQETSHSDAESFLYQTAMRYTLPIGRAGRVALVTITEGVEPLDVLNNTCANRRFISDLVPELDSLGAKVIAIDQSYSQGSCNEEPANDGLREALEGAGKPVVVGERSHSRSDDVGDGDCLVEAKNFDFMRKGNGSPVAKHDNVTFGLLKLNSDERKIPLFWWVFPDESSSEDNKLAPATKDGFALAVAKLADQKIRADNKLQTFVNSNEHPYTNLIGSFPTWSAMDVLCYGPHTIAASHPEWGSCASVAHQPFKLAGKVVVVGDHIESDIKHVDGDRYGVDLHAEYIEALLDRRYLGAAAEWIGEVAIILFVLLAVACEAASVRKTKGGEDDVLEPVRLAGILTIAAFLLGVGGGCLLWFGHLFMPDFLAAYVAILVGLFGPVYYAALMALSNQYRLTRGKKAR
jgi:hypothetical protein